MKEGDFEWKNVKKESKKIFKKGIALTLAGTMIGTVFVGFSKKFIRRYKLI